MQCIECSICSDRFDDSESSDVIVTPCGHVFHQICMTDWLYKSPSKTCPDCCEWVTIPSIRRIYFKRSSVSDNMQTHIDSLNTEIILKANELHIAKLQNLKIKNECSNQLREKDCEIQRLNEKLKKMKHKLKDNKVKNKMVYDKIISADNMMGAEHLIKLNQWLPGISSLQNTPQNLMQNSNMQQNYQAIQSSNIGTIRNTESSRLLSQNATVANENKATTSTDPSIFFRSMAAATATIQSGHSLSGIDNSVLDQQSRMWIEDNSANFMALNMAADQHRIRERMMSISQQRNSISIPQNYQSPLIQNIVVAPLLLASNTAAQHQQNINYQHNLFIQQHQQQHNVSLNANGNASYINASNNGQFFPDFGNL